MIFFITFNITTSQSRYYTLFVAEAKERWLELGQARKELDHRQRVENEMLASEEIPEDRL